MLAEEEKSKVYELRNKTGLGLINCKKMLEINKYNVDHAIEYIKLTKQSFIPVMVTYSQEGMRILSEYHNLYESKLKTGISAYEAALEIKEENPELFNEYIKIHR